MTVPNEPRPKRTFYKVEQNTLDWQMLRIARPTASAFDRIITSKRGEPSRQRKPYMRRLNAEWIMKEPLEDEEYRTRWMERGQALEDRAIAAYEVYTELETSPGGFWTLETGGDEAGCSPDRLIGSDGVLEIKAPLLSTQVAAALDGVEANHVVQIQGQLWITGRRYCDVFSYHPALILPPKRVQRDEEFIEKLAKSVHEFIAEMLRERRDLEREYGPFLRAGTQEPPLWRPDDLITEADLDSILRMRQEQ